VAPVLVGRSLELSALSEALTAVTGGSGRFVHITGEAGIGKTSLLLSAVDQITRQEIAFRSVTVDETDRRRRLALLRTLLPETDHHPEPDPISAAVAVAERLAAAGPVALVADDVHWADEESIDALRALASRAPQLGVLVLTAARPYPASVGLRRLEELATRTGQRLSPRGLPAAELARLVGDLSGAAPGPQLAELLAKTEGNPFLAVELVSGLQAEGRLVVQAGQAEVEPAGEVPEDVGSRLARQTFLAVPGDELLVRAAAVLPGGFTVEELAAMLDRGLAEVLASALAAVSAGVLTDTGSTLAFRHELLRQAVLGITPASIVRTLHRRAADVLTARGADPERITTCLLEGCDPAEPADRDRLQALAGRIRDHSPGAAADLLRCALDGVPRHDPRSTTIALDLGWALVAAGRASEVPGLIEERLTDLPEPRPVDLHRLVGIALGLAGRLDDVIDRYADVDVDRLTRHFDPGDAEVVDAAAEMGLLWVNSERLADAQRLVEWVDMSPTAASPFRRASVETVRAWIAAVEGRFDGAVVHSRAALQATAEDATHRATPGSPTLVLALALDFLGESDDALHVLRGAVGRVTTPRWTPALLQLGTALILFRAGEWDDALAEVDAGLLAAEEADLGLGTYWPYAIGTLIACSRGQLAVARQWLDRSRAVTSRRALGAEWLAYADAVVHETDGNLEPAAKLLSNVAERIIAARVPTLLLNMAPDTVRLALSTGRATVADHVVTELDAIASRSISPVAAGIARWARGLCDAEAAEVEAAADDLSACRRTPSAARARHDAAVLAARRGDESDARRLAKEAFAAYEGLGAEQLHVRLRADLRSCGLAMRPRRAAPHPAHGWASLTASEQAVVGLVSEGLTNTEIGQRLFISRRTVESHLGRVYAKLGVATRAQLVGAALRRADGVDG
jgi:ATP/maltotriose-dependent transcriptional regulator MalT